MRIWLLSILFLGLTATLFAQKGLKVGVFGVPQISYLNNADDNSYSSDIYNQEALPTMAGGVTVGVGFTDMFGIRFSPTLAQQGGAFTAVNDGETVRYVERLNYLKLPLMLGFNTSPVARKFIYSLYIGASLDLLTGAKSFNDNPFFFVPSNVSIPPVQDRYMRMGYSFIGETGFDIQLPPENFTLNLRLRGDYGLNDAEDKTTTYRVVSNGQVNSFNYWNNVRGVSRSAVTQALNLGFLIGITYVLQ